MHDSISIINTTCLFIEYEMHYQWKRIFTVFLDGLLQSVIKMPMIDG
jgi:hypothetical protein